MHYEAGAPFLSIGNAQDLFQCWGVSTWLDRLEKSSKLSTHLLLDMQMDGGCTLS